MKSALYLGIHVTKSCGLWGQGWLSYQTFPEQVCVGLYSILFWAHFLAALCASLFTELGEVSLIFLWEHIRPQSSQLLTFQSLKAELPTPKHYMTPSIYVTNSIYGGHPREEIKAYWLRVRELCSSHVLISRPNLEVDWKLTEAQCHLGSCSRDIPACLGSPVPRLAWYSWVSQHSPAATAEIHPWPERNAQIGTRDGGGMHSAPQDVALWYPIFSLVTGE